MARPRKFKTIKHYHQPSDLHELTFSCYRQMKLITNDTWRGYLARSIDEAGEQFRFQFVAFVIMPEHIHLLVFPLDEEPSRAGYLAAIKRPVSADVKRDLQRAGSPLVNRLTIRDRPGKEAFRFWQEGPGYDRKRIDGQSNGHDGMSAWRAAMPGYPEMRSRAQPPPPSATGPSVS